MIGETAGSGNEARTWQRAWEYHKQLDAVMASRTGYLLVAQAALIAAFSALFASSRESEPVRLAQYSICVLGIGLVLVQWVIASRASKQLTYLKERYLVPLCAIYRSERGHATAPSEELQTYGIPIALWIVWVILFELALPL